MARKINVSGEGSESQEQQALIQWWRSGGRKALGLPEHALLMAIPNGGARSAVTGARMKAEGALVGVPDLLLAWPADGRAGLWIELKRRRGGRLSPAQAAVMDALSAAGYATAVAHGWQEAVAEITAYAGGCRHVSA